jgi:hypothetical protein
MLSVEQGCVLSMITNGPEATEGTLLVQAADEVADMLVRELRVAS